MRCFWAASELGLFFPARRRLPSHSHTLSLSALQISRILAPPPPQHRRPQPDSATANSPRQRLRPPLSPAAQLRLRRTSRFLPTEVLRGASWTPTTRTRRRRREPLRRERRSAPWPPIPAAAAHRPPPPVMLYGRRIRESPKAVDAPLRAGSEGRMGCCCRPQIRPAAGCPPLRSRTDRKSTRLNSSHPV